MGGGGKNDFAFCRNLRRTEIVKAGALLHNACWVYIGRIVWLGWSIVRGGTKYTNEEGIKDGDDDNDGRQR